MANYLAQTTLNPVVSNSWDQESDPYSNQFWSFVNSENPWLSHPAWTHPDHQGQPYEGWNSYQPQPPMYNDEHESKQVTSYMDSPYVMGDGSPLYPAEWTYPFQATMGTSSWHSSPLTDLTAFSDYNPTASFGDGSDLRFTYDQSEPLTIYESQTEVICTSNVSSYPQPTITLPVISAIPTIHVVEDPLPPSMSQEYPVDRAEAVLGTETQIQNTFRISASSPCSMFHPQTKDGVTNGSPSIQSKYLADDIPHYRSSLPTHTDIGIVELRKHNNEIVPHPESSKKSCSSSPASSIPVMSESLAVSSTESSSSNSFSSRATTPEAIPGTFCLTVQDSGSSSVPTGKGKKRRASRQQLEDNEEFVDNESKRPAKRQRQTPRSERVKVKGRSGKMRPLSDAIRPPQYLDEHKNPIAEPLNSPLAKHEFGSDWVWANLNPERRDAVMRVDTFRKACSQLPKGVGWFYRCTCGYMVDRHDNNSRHFLTHRGETEEQKINLIDDMKKDKFLCVGPENEAWSYQEEKWIPLESLKFPTRKHEKGKKEKNVRRM